jgi:hypothetical protein
MKKKMTKTALTLFTLILSSSPDADVFAGDSWDIVQNFTAPGTDTTLEQKGTAATTKSHQALNVVFGLDTVSQGSQNVTMGTHNLTLNQLANLTDAVQTTNYVEAGVVGSGSAFIQNFTSTSTGGTTDSATLWQRSALTGGSADTQGINVAKGTTFTKLQQNLTASGELDLEQSTTTQNNHQVLNSGEADTITDLKQVITTAHDLVLLQEGGTTTNIQAGNCSG